jgi:hypothetical protein
MRHLATLAPSPLPQLPPAHRTNSVLQTQDFLVAVFQSRDRY